MKLHFSLKWLLLVYVFSAQTCPAPCPSLAIIYLSHILSHAIPFQHILLYVLKVKFWSISKIPVARNHKIMMVSGNASELNYLPILLIFQIVCSFCWEKEAARYTLSESLTLPNTASAWIEQRWQRTSRRLKLLRMSFANFGLWFSAQWIDSCGCSPAPTGMRVGFWEPRADT